MAYSRQGCLLVEELVRMKVAPSLFEADNEWGYQAE